MKIYIATRDSQLALWQAENVKSELLKLDSSLDIELKELKTKGDILLDTSLAKIGGKGLFVKEIENALLTGEAHIAVHSMKDMPAEFPEGLVLSAIMEREDPRDAFVSNRFSKIADLPEGAVVGTSSLRRASQLLAMGKYEIKMLRGNVNTRLRKLDEGEYQAIVLACAGLIRLEFEDRIADQFAVDQMIPSAGQGAVGVQCRSVDKEVTQLVEQLNCSQTATAVSAEREFNAIVGGSCQIPAGCHVTIDGNKFKIRGFISEIDGSKIYKNELEGDIADLKGKGTALGQSLLDAGGAAIIKKILN